MQTVIPTPAAALRSLLRADFTAQWRNRRSVILVVLVPVIILFAWKGMVSMPIFGGAFVLSNCITIGLNAVGLMGYSNSLARDRDKGIFQRLRVAPAPSWCIMISRLIVQLAMIVLVTLSVFFFGKTLDGITMTLPGYIVAFCMALVGGALYLALGQMIVGLVKNPETVNAVSRLVYFVFIMVGMFAEMGALGSRAKEILEWSPYGVVKHLVSTGLRPELWSNKTTVSLLLALGYTVLFAAIGIKKFKWTNK